LICHKLLDLLIGQHLVVLSSINPPSRMGFQTSDLWRRPVLNPANKKARSVPILNPVDKHGRVFFFSWLGFMLAFWAWYTFPPLVCLSL
jgi:NNP family nitrate/nitrite transporter-like MFS transporter